jgi:hypothetical protein
VVEMLSVAVPGPAPLNVTGLVEPNVTMGSNCAPAGIEVMAAVSATFPVNPLLPLTLMASAALLPAVSVTPGNAALRDKPGAADTTSVKLVDPMRLPETPVTVTVVVPRLAALVAFSLITLEVVEGFVAKLAVTPAGKPLTESVIPAVKPPAAETLMVSDAVAPETSETVAVPGAKVKLGAALTMKLCYTCAAA